MVGKWVALWFGVNQVGSLVLPKQCFPSYNHRDI